MSDDREGTPPDVFDMFYLAVPAGTTLEHDPAPLDGVYQLRYSRALECAQVLLRLRPDSALYLTLGPNTGTAIITHADPDDDPCAGSGVRFLLEVLVSLINGRPVDLRGVQALDPISMAACTGMLRAYWRPADE